MSFMANEAASARPFKRLGRRHLLRLKAAEAWITLGDYEEARKEFHHLPRYAQNHADAALVRTKLQQVAGLVA